jgi:DNA-binding IclR family transcriptional regulator
LDRAFGILKYLRERRCPVRPSEIADAIGAPKSSLYEIVNSLLEKDILEYVGGEGRIYLGRELHFLGSAYLSNFDLTREADSYLKRITFETRETSQLCMLSGNEYTVVVMREGTRSFRISSDVGELVPLPWTTSGRLLTSHLTEAQIHDLIPESDFVLPDGSKVGRDTFLAESLAAQEERFYACESVVDSFTHCLAASVHDERGTCIATLCLIAPKEDAEKNFQDYTRILRTGAQKLSEKLSGFAAG